MMFARKPSSLSLPSSSMFDNADDNNVHGDKHLEALNFGQNAGAQLVQRPCDGLSLQVRDLRL